MWSLRKKFVVLSAALVVLFPLFLYIKGSSAAVSPYTVTRVYCYDGELYVNNTLSGKKCELDSEGDNVGETDSQGNCETWRDENLGRTLEDAVAQADEFYDGFDGRGERGVGRVKKERPKPPPPPPED